MDYRYNGRNPYRRSNFGSVEGTIVEIAPARMGNRRADGCIIYVTIEDGNGDTVVFIMSPDTYVVDYETLSVGMMCTFWYRMDAPMPLIYPPQYSAVVAAMTRNDRRVEVGYFNNNMINEDMTLQLNMDGMVDVRTTNNQYYQGNPANHNLVVTYETSTRSIPAQATPQRVVVLCDQS